MMECKYNFKCNILKNKSISIEDQILSAYILSRSILTVELIFVRKIKLLKKLLLKKNIKNNITIQ